jgi:hypothetical protein
LPNRAETFFSLDSSKLNRNCEKVYQMNIKSVECSIETNKSLEFSKHSRGFTTYSLSDGANSVLILTYEETGEETSVRLARELVLEIAGKPPLERWFNTNGAVLGALYKFGTHVLQYESQKVSGELIINSISADGTAHGSLKLTFSEPGIDLAGMRQAALVTDF